MKLGTFDIPDVRLIPASLTTLEEIYKVKKRDKVQSKDLAILLGYKYGTEAHFYRRVHALAEYGLIEGKGIFQVSDLGEKILHPRNDQEKSLATTKAVLSVSLWKEIYQKHGKTPRGDNFWAVLVDITKVDPETAKTNASKIIGWYQNDIAHISDNLVGQDLQTDQRNNESKGLSSKKGNNTSMSQILTEVPQESYGRFILPNVGFVDVTDEDTLEIARSYLKVLEKKVKSGREIRTASSQIESDTQQEL